MAGVRRLEPLDRLRAWALIAFLAATGALAWDPVPVSPVWAVVHSDGLQLRNVTTETGSRLFAMVPNTVAAGTLLQSSAVNEQPDFQSCAASCLAVPACNVINWCPLTHVGDCEVGPGGEVLHRGGCKLRNQPSVDAGGEVYHIASGFPSLGDAAALVRVDPPDPIPEGYTLFMAEILLDAFQLSCPETKVPGKCVLYGNLEEAVALCNARPDCQAVNFGPRGRGNVTQPLGVLKGAPKGQPLDLGVGRVNPSAYTLIKNDALEAARAAEGSAPAPAPAPADDGSLSGGAIAGIAGSVAGAVAAVCMAALYVLLKRRRRQRRALRLRTALNGIGNGSSPALLGQANGAQGAEPADLDEVLTNNPPETSRGSPTRALAQQLFSSMPNPRWEDFIVPRSQLKFCRSPVDGRPVRLGGGASGNVFKVVFSAHTVCACKVFDFRRDSSLRHHFTQEAAVLRRVNHPSVVQFFGVSVTEGQGLLLMELMASDLSQALELEAPGGRGRLYGWANRGHSAALQIASGLAYLHQNGILHLDLKPANVLLARDGSVKLADCGFSRVLRDKEITRAWVGTWGWAAPEVLVGEPASDKADVYSFGVLLWQLCTGNTILRRGWLPPLEAPMQCPPEVAALQRRCVALDPAERPTAAEIVDTLRALPPAQPPATPPRRGGQATPRAPSLSPPGDTDVPAGSEPTLAARQKLQQQTATPAADSELGPTGLAAAAAAAGAELAPLPTPFSSTPPPLEASEPGLADSAFLRPAGSLLPGAAEGMMPPAEEREGGALGGQGWQPVPLRAPSLSGLLAGPASPPAAGAAAAAAPALSRSASRALQPFGSVQLGGPETALGAEGAQERAAGGERAAAGTDQPEEEQPHSVAGPLANSCRPSDVAAAAAEGAGVKRSSAPAPAGPATARPSLAFEFEAPSWQRQQ